MKHLFVLFQYCAPQHLLSRVAGALAASKNKIIKRFFINTFSKKFGISLEEYQIQNEEEFESFNDFFCRALKPEARPINQTSLVVSPADGAFSQVGDIKNGEIFQAKRRMFTSEDILASAELAKQFEGGKFATIYLSPKDYHRVHMPISGRLCSMSYIPGNLFSVNEATTECVPRLFARNERAVCIFDTEIGKVAIILVGAMIVAGIETVWAGQIAPAATRHIEHWQYDDMEHILEKGQELGRFKLGSTVVMLFQKHSINWHHNAQPGAVIKMGEGITT